MSERVYDFGVWVLFSRGMGRKMLKTFFVVFVGAQLLYKQLLYNCKEHRRGCEKGKSAKSAVLVWPGWFENGQGLNILITLFFLMFYF